MVLKWFWDTPKFLTVVTSSKFEGGDICYWNTDFSGKSNGYNTHLNITSLFFHISLATVFLLDIQGHEKEALQLMATYLPKDTSPGSAYQEGGGLYALGLIHANHGGDIIDYLLNQLKNASNDVCTGLSNEPLFFLEDAGGCWLV